MHEITERIGLTRTHVSKRPTSLSKKTLSGSMTLRHSKKMTLLSTRIRLGHIEKNRIFTYLGKGYVSRDQSPWTNKDIYHIFDTEENNQL